VTHEAIATLRTRAELALRLAGETRDTAARAGLLEIASTLRAEADMLETAIQQRGAPASGNE